MTASTARLAAIESRLVKLEGRKLASCLTLVMIAYGIEFTAEQKARARELGFPGCSQRPSEEAVAEMVGFLTQHLIIVPYSQPTRGDCCAFRIKSSESRPDHLGVLTRSGLWHLDNKQGVVVVPFDRRWQDRLMMVLRRP